jgi:Ca2+-binding RTX toxin-like protein
VTFDANWNMTGVSGVWDNNSATPLTFKDIAAAYDTALWFATPFDPNQGAPAALGLTGGSEPDTLFGFAGNDTLNGAGGNDVITGGTGNDILTGGTGDDRFVFHNGDGLDTITDFTPGSGSNDVVELHGYDVANFTALQALMTQSGADTIITFDPNDTITLHNVTAAQLNAGDFILS